MHDPNIFCLLKGQGHESKWQKYRFFTYWPCIIACTQILKEIEETKIMSCKRAYHTLIISENIFVISAKVKVTDAFKPNFSQKMRFLTKVFSPSDSKMSVWSNYINITPLIDPFMVMMHVPNNFWLVTSQGHTGTFFDVWYFTRVKKSKGHNSGTV